MKIFFVYLVFFAGLISNYGCKEELNENFENENFDEIIFNLNIHLDKFHEIFTSKDFTIQSEYDELDPDVRVALSIEEKFIISELNKVIDKEAFFEFIGTTKALRANIEKTNSVVGTPCYDAYENATNTILNGYLACMTGATITANPAAMGICTLGMAVGSLTAKSNFNNCMTNTYGAQ